MYNRKVYDPEFKLNVVKEHLNDDKSQVQICEEYSISPSMFFKWLKKYKESGYDDSVFNVEKGRPESIILDYYEKILLEKEIQLRIALDQIELLKKTNKKGNQGK